WSARRGRRASRSRRSRSHPRTVHPRGDRIRSGGVRSPYRRCYGASSRNRFSRGGCRAVERAAGLQVLQRELRGQRDLADALSGTTLRAMDLASRLRASRAASSFTESVIREMTRLAQVHDAINLGQGFPDFPAPAEVKEAAARAIAEDHNQYPITWGVPAFRDAIASVYAGDYGMAVDPETEICVTCGATEAMSSAFLGLLDPGDEVVVFEPFYESYGPDAILSGARLRYVTLRPPDWTFDPQELAAAFGSGTRAIVIGSPHNPTGKVFSRQELEQIAELCVRHDAVAITDEIYEHITYDGAA